MSTLLNDCRMVRVYIARAFYFIKDATVYYIGSSPVCFYHEKILYARECAIQACSMLMLLIPKIAKDSRVLPFYQNAYYRLQSFLLATQFCVNNS